MQTSAIWSQPLYTIVTAFENVLLDDSNRPLQSSLSVRIPPGGNSHDVSHGYAGWRSGGAVKSASSSEAMSPLDSPIPILSLKRKITTDPWGDREAKNLKLSSALSFRLARSLSVSESDRGTCEPTVETSQGMVDEEGEEGEAMQCSPERRPLAASNPRLPMSKTFNFGGMSPWGTKPAGELSTGDVGKGSLSPDKRSVFSSDDGTNSGSDGSIAVYEFGSPSLRAKNTQQSVLPPVLENLDLPVPSFTVEQWIHTQAHLVGIPEAEFRRFFEENLATLQTQLQKLYQNPVLVDYPTLKQLVMTTQAAGQWLSDHHYPFLPQVLPGLITDRDTLVNATRYVLTMEDMIHISSMSTSSILEQLASSQMPLDDYLAAKRRLYGDLLKQNGLPWRAWGYPVNEQFLQHVREFYLNLLQCYTQEFRRIFSMWNNSSSGLTAERLANANAYLRAEFQGASPTPSAIMDKLLLTIQRAGRCVEFVGETSSPLAVDCFALASEYIRWRHAQAMKSLVDTKSISQFDPDHISMRSNRQSNGSSSLGGGTHKSKAGSSAQLMFHCEQVIRTFSYLRAIRDGELTTSDLPFGYRKANLSGESGNELVAVLSEFAAALVDISLTLADHLLAQKSQNQFDAPSGSLCIYVEFCLRWVKKVLDFSGTNGGLSRRLKPLYESLRNLEAMV
ncbi:hypothetical protein IWQ62_001740 [Dispira parvispora]|uniref:Uncharacterized protein n=1 Tax=Dispira parvispora TaxID=1520584 RepID=A0A9W8ASV4_9FUNG|nr:hypothetical protein IWQ62_001740 [Dispira parvispora]